MRTKGVLLLGFVVCWIAVCNAEDGYLYDDGLEDSLSRELAEDKLFRAYDVFHDDDGVTEVECTDDPSKCSVRQECVEKEEGGGTKICKCREGLSGKDCQTLDWCNDVEKFGNCKKPIGECNFNEEEKQFVCTCVDGKVWDDGRLDGEKTCRTDCTRGEKCSDREECLYAGDKKICKCRKGFSGYECETLDWCEVDEKFGKCKDSNGKCEYNDGKKEIVCNCGDGKEWDDGEKKCKNTCSEHEDCSKNEKCKEKGDLKFCECADGLGGDDCKKTVWCEGTGKFKNCHGVNGTCEYIEEKRSVDCLCSDGKQLQAEDNICKAVSCTDDSICGEKGKCVGDEGSKICKCAEGLSGIGCETLDWCKDPEKFENCKEPDAKCEYDKGEKSVVCTCGTLKKWNPEEKTCKDTCFKHDDCADNEKCVENNGWKSCQCADGLSGDNCSKNDWCEGDGKFQNCKDGNGTCEYIKDKRAVDCTCDTGKKLHPTENRCRETCQEDSECQNGGKCEGKDGEDKFCSCKSGLIGDKCQTVFDCTSGKYKGCDASGGTCKYDGSKAVCECSGNKKLHDKENICKDTCSKNEECTENQKCVENNGWKSCECADGLGGDDCKKTIWCEGNGKFKNCKGVNGTCEYSLDKRSVDCLCSDGKKLHPTENRCRETCSEDSDCQNGGKCEEIGGNKFCTCKLGVVGDKCQTVYDCSLGIYKGCQKSGGNCTYDGSKAVCECFSNKKLHDKENVCKECDCGPKGTCKFEGGVKKCECNSGAELKDGKCRETCDEDCENDGECKEIGESKFCECKTGTSGDKCQIVDDCQKTLKDCKDERGTCEYDTEQNKAVCTCHHGDKEFNPAVNYCQETCSSKDECNGGTCSGTEEKKGFCKCLAGKLEGDKCDIVIDCVRGKYSKCEATDGTCHFKEGTSKCDCHDDKKLDDRSTKQQFCRKKCTSDNECTNGAKCEKELCNCPPGTEGDDCGKITACDTLKCEDKKAVCTYNFTLSENTFCVCEDSDYIFVKKDQKCVEKCKTEGFCIHGGTCNSKTNLCDCKKNTKGEKCQDIIGCDKLKCPDKISECVYDIKSMEAICKCKEPNHYFEKGECKAEWCRNGCNLAVSTCKYENGVGTCTCKTEGTYYDYTAKTCKKFDSCFNKTCEGDQICKSGKCQCPENYKANGTICEKMDLCKSKCFPGAKCEEGTSYGYVKCSCDVETKFYLPRLKKCDDGKCFLPDGRKDCNKPCPPGMKFNDGNCRYDKDEINCDEDCGFLGWCKKTGEKKTDCVCLPQYAEKDTKTKKCVLKASAVCPKERDGPGKCKCEDKYKLANNGITCELKTCSDEDVQKECKSIGASCVDSFKNGVGYDCKCPTGYTKVKGKGCLDPCSLGNMKDTCSSNGQVCYIGDSLQVGDCRCPPTFTYNAYTKSCDLDGDNTFMIRKLPVMKKKYETIENNINEVTLNIDVRKSMDQAFRNLEFVHVFSFKVDKDVLLCDVWLQFKPNLDTAFNATLEVRRWKSHTVRGDNEYLLPPDLLLSSTDIDAASEEELTICSPSVQQSVCGSGSLCVDNKCTCAEGFREIESTLRQSSTKRIVRCEDIDECAEGTHNCKDNSKCVNTLGSYFCKCNSGFKKEKGDAYAMDKEACVDLCHGNPCGKGTCQLTKENTIDCTCQVGYTGSFCNKADVNLAKAGKATKVVGAVLGTLLAIVIILIIVYIVRQRKNSYSEDFTPAPRVDNAEMIERRPMRGVTNRGYQ